MITVLGSINLDLVATAERLPVAGETVVGRTFETSPGGKGANQALAATRSGRKVRMVGAVGSDHFAETALNLLREAGTYLSMVKTVCLATGTAVILVDASGENMITVIAGANDAVDVRRANAAFEGADAGDLMMMQLEIPATTVEHALTAAREHGAITILNTAKMHFGWPRSRTLSSRTRPNSICLRVLPRSTNRGVWRRSAVFMQRVDRPSS